MVMLFSYADKSVHASVLVHHTTLGMRIPILAVLVLLPSKATCTRTRVFSKTELFDPGYIETVTRIRTYPELFENARAPKRSFSKTLPKVDLSNTKVSDPDLFCV